MAAQVKKAGSGGTFWFVFVGHGYPSKTGDDGMLVGANAPGDVDSLDEHSVAQQEVFGALRQGKQANSVVLFDACFSGASSSTGKPLVPGVQATLPTRKKDEPIAKLTVLSASDSFAGPLKNGGRPAFSYLMLGALRGWGDGNADKVVNVDEAFRFASDTLSQMHPGTNRKPPLSGPSQLKLAQRAREGAPDLLASRRRRRPVKWRRVPLARPARSTVREPLQQSR